MVFGKYSCLDFIFLIAKRIKVVLKCVVSLAQRFLIFLFFFVISNDGSVTPIHTLVITLNLRYFSLYFACAGVLLLLIGKPTIHKRKSLICHFIFDFAVMLKDRLYRVGITEEKSVDSLNLALYLLNLFLGSGEVHRLQFCEPFLLAVYFYGDNILSFLKWLLLLSTHFHDVACGISSKHFGNRRIVPLEVLGLNLASKFRENRSRFVLILCYEAREKLTR